MEGPRGICIGCSDNLGEQRQLRLRHTPDENILEGIYHRLPRDWVRIFE